MRASLIGGCLLLLIALGVPVSGEEPAPVPSCGDCHDEQAKAFITNPHGHGTAVQGVIPNAVCERCHGDGKAHIEAGGDKSLIYKPAGVAGADKTCLSCHDLATDRVTRHSGPHSNPAPGNCLPSHSIHSPPRSTPLLAKPELALCNTCHMTQVASFRNKPYAH